MSDEPIRRTMVVSSEIDRLLTGPWRSVSEARRCGQLRADLEAFVKGDQLGVGLTPRKARTAYMARLDQSTDEVWDIRSRDPDPGIRILGRFADKDLFVALLWAPRSVEISWSPRPPSREWRDAVVECKAAWNHLLYPYPPIHGENLGDYISSNAFLV